MLHVISRLSIVAKVSLLTVLLCPCEQAFAQGTKVSAGGGSSGAFLGPGEVGGGSLQLGLTMNFVFARANEGNLSRPALFCAFSYPPGEKKRFAYLCLVTHRFAGDQVDVAGQFRHRLHVLDGEGELELSGGAGRSSFNILYATSVNPTFGAPADESLTIRKMPVNLAGGRVFLVDISGDTPVVEQVDYPLPDAPAGDQEFAKKVLKIVDDLKESIAAGTAKKVALKFAD